MREVRPWSRSKGYDQLYVCNIKVPFGAKKYTLSAIVQYHFIISVLQHWSDSQWVSLSVSGCINKIDNFIKT